MKKLISFMFILSFVFSLASCGVDNNDNEPTTEEYNLPTQVVNSDISLPFTSAAGFNPFETESSLNRDIIPIIYESLFVSEDSGEALPLLAVSGKVEGKTVTVKLSQNALFSDGMEFLGESVKESFKNAKNSAYYSEQLKNIASVTVIDNYTVRFNLNNPDSQALNVLNFPIAKKNGKEYIGTGKYYLAKLQDDLYLQVNNKHRDYKETWNKQIALYDMVGITSPLYPFKANKISVYKNDLTQEYINLSSKTVSVGTDNLVYIGVNSKWSGSVTSIEWVRQAINIGIDRTTITASSFLGQGTATATPFKNAYKELDNVEIIGTHGNIEKAVGILERHGYNKFNDDGVRTNGSSSLRVNILVCVENQYKLTVSESFKTALEKLGFGVTITKKKTAEDFIAAVKEGHYSFYVGEAKLTPNCDLSEFFTEKGELNYGVNESMYEIYDSYNKGEINTATFVEGFCTNVPFLPLFYRKEVVSVNSNIKGLDTTFGLYSSVCDWKMQKEQ